MNGEIKMPFSKDEIEYYHNVGLMPDWAYYQQNGKSAQENYIQQKRNKRRNDKQKNLKLDKLIEDQIEKSLEEILKELNL